MSEKGKKFHLYILAGLILGAIAGGIVNSLAGDGGLPNSIKFLLKNVTDPIGEIFKRMLLMTVVPLVFASLSLGVARFGDLTKLGRIGLKTFAYFLFTTAFAVGIGLILVNIIQPGRGLPKETTEQLMAEYAGESEKKLESNAKVDVNTFVNIVPKNPLSSASNPNNSEMLPIIFVAILVGVGITRLRLPLAQSLTTFLEAVGEITVFIIQIAMMIAPVGVFCLIFGTTARFGFDLLGQLAWYVGTVLLAIGIMAFVVYPIILVFLAKQSPFQFYYRARAIILTAFSTSSSSATLPTSIKISHEELKVPKPIAGFVIPLGATTNMNGTSLFEGITALFLAQVFGQNLEIGTQLFVVLMCVLTAVGAAGVPGGSIPLLASVLIVANVPPAAIALILGVDRILDMCRTTLNVVGDVTAAVVITRFEGKNFPDETPGEVHVVESSHVLPPT
ncbi:MAG: dicarboxylate/amino acid:cation symporter [Zavarzinella sp.]